MKIWMSVILAALILLPLAALGADEKPEEAIRATAMNYIEGWYDGDAERMAKALHPKLAKRAYLKNPKTGEFVLQELDAETLIGYVKKGGAKDVAPEDRKIKMEILDIYENIATAKVSCKHFVDYMHLVYFEGEWKIINVLWDFSPEYYKELEEKRKEKSQEKEG